MLKKLYHGSLQLLKVILTRRGPVCLWYKHLLLILDGKRCLLHFTESSKSTEDGETQRVDMECRVCCYTSDLSLRTGVTRIRCENVRSDIFSGADTPRGNHVDSHPPILTSVPMHPDQRIGLALTLLKDGNARLLYSQYRAQCPVQIEDAAVLLIKGTSDQTVK